MIRRARSRAAARARRRAACASPCVNAEVTPTWCSVPSSSYSPSSSEPTASGPLLCQRKPATTQSAVRACLILSIARLPGWYVPVVRLRDDAVEARAFEARQPLRGSARSRVIGVRWIGGSTFSERFLEQSRAARAAARRGCPGRRRASRSKATNDAGVSFASFATRDAAGMQAELQRIEVEPVVVAMTISPSMTQPSGRRSSSARAARGSTGPAAADHGSGCRRRRRREKRWRGSRPTSARRGTRPRPASHRRASRASARSGELSEMA